MIKFLKYVSTPIDMIINKISNGKMEDIIWSALTRYECKTKGIRGKVTLHYNKDEIVTGSYFCGWLLTDDDRLIHIEPIRFLKENFQEMLDS